MKLNTFNKPAKYKTRTILKGKSIVLCVYMNIDYISVI